MLARRKQEKLVTSAELVAPLELDDDDKELPLLSLAETHIRFENALKLDRNSRLELSHR